MERPGPIRSVPWYAVVGCAADRTFPHDDPFDRMIIVQAARLGARIVTCDDAIRRHVKNCVC
jgi:PIN domain nuclease of toxin-antitoxin system